MLPPGYRTATPDGTVVTVYCGDQKVHEERAANQSLPACIAAQERAEAWAQAHADKAAEPLQTSAPTPGLSSAPAPAAAPAPAPRAPERKRKRGT